MTKHLLTFAAAAAIALGAYAEDATLVNSYNALWYYYNIENEDMVKPDATSTRTLEQYSDGTFKIINPFGSGKAKDVLKFVTTESNITFQGLKSASGMKYLYYNSPEYCYVADTTYENGDYSGYYTEDGWQCVFFYIYGDPGDGYIYMYWNEDCSAVTDITDSDATPVYYNLQGVRIADGDMRPGLYIMKKGNTASKVLLR